MDQLILEGKRGGGEWKEGGVTAGEMDTGSVITVYTPGGFGGRRKTLTQWCLMCRGYLATHLERWRRGEERRGEERRAEQRRGGMRVKAIVLHTR